MEDLIYRKLSDEIIFKSDILQERLIEFENSVLRLKDDELSFLYNLIRFKEVFLSGATEKWRLQVSNKGGMYFYPFMLSNFGLNQSYVYKCIAVIKSFTNYDTCTNSANFCYLKDFKEYSLSKLFELLPLTKSELDKALRDKSISSTLTIKQFRERVKEIKGKTKPEKKEKIEEEKTILLSTYKSELKALKLKVLDVVEKYLMVEDNFSVYNSARGEINSLFNVLLKDFTEAKN